MFRVVEFRDLGFRVLPYYFGDVAVGFCVGWSLVGRTRVHGFVSNYSINSEVLQATISLSLSLYVLYIYICTHTYKNSLEVCTQRKKFQL